MGPQTWRFTAGLSAPQGTEIYDAKRGTLVDLGILDVMQIFGRAGRPQFDQQGQGTIITSHDKLGHYLTLLTQQNPIESQFLASLADNLNAEVSAPPPPWPPRAPGPADALSLAPGGPGLRHQRGGGSEVAELHLPVRAPEGQPSGLRGQPQAPPGWCRRGRGRST